MFMIYSTFTMWRNSIYMFYMLLIFAGGHGRSLLWYDNWKLYRHQTFATEKLLNVEKDQAVTFFEHLKLIVFSETEMNDSW